MRISRDNIIERSSVTVVFIFIMESDVFKPLKIQEGILVSLVGEAQAFALLTASGKTDIHFFNFERGSGLRNARVSEVTCVRSGRV